MAADETMQSIAAENNLSETAFFVPKGKSYHIRWFTPACEVDLCGDATLASAYVLCNILGHEKDVIAFDSKSGILKVAEKSGWLVMDFPLQTPVPCDIPDEIAAAFDKKPVHCLKAEDYIIVFESEDDIASANPDLGKLHKLDLRGVIITATSTRFDFVSRFFAPKYAIPEDSVTG